MAIEDDHEDVLQNIEFIVANHHKRLPEMTDYEVLRTYEVLVQVYSAEVTGRIPKPISLSGMEADLFRDIKGICEWRLGREAELSRTGAPLPETSLTVDI